jgi:hypothetical protein
MDSYGGYKYSMKYFETREPCDSRVRGLPAIFVHGFAERKTFCLSGVIGVEREQPVRSGSGEVVSPQRDSPHRICAVDADTARTKDRPVKSFPLLL